MNEYNYILNEYEKYKNRQIEEVIQNTYNNAIEDSQLDMAADIAVNNVLIEVEKQWENIELQKLGQTPKKYFEKLNEKQLFDVFNIICIEYGNCFPRCFTEKFLEIENVEIKCLQILTNISNSSSLSECNLAVGALEIIRLLKVKIDGVFFSKKLMEVMENISGDSKKDFLVEQIVNTITEFGECVLPLLLTKLNNSKEIKAYHEDYLITMALIGKDYKRNEIYITLKEVFTRMKNKVYGAVCFGIYNDSRAITFLRGYLAKNSEKIDKQLYIELKASVEKLGGQVKDINVKFN